MPSFACCVDKVRTYLKLIIFFIDIFLVLQDQQFPIELMIG